MCSLNVRLKAIITVFLWALVLLILASAIVPFTHSAFLPYFQILPSFDLVFWMGALGLLIATSLRKRSPVLPVFTFLLATALLVWRGYGSLPDFEDKPHEKVTVLCLNVGQFNNDTAAVNGTIEEINLHHPDILCLQEFGLYYKWPDVASVAKDFSERTGLAYYDFTPYPGNIFGTAVFSRYPILSSDTIFNMLSATNEAKSYVFDVHGQELRLTNMHLQSYNLMGSKNGASNSGDDLVETLSRRRSQVKILVQHKADIVVGDLNASVGSIYYETIANKWRDVQRAYGMGLLPTHAYVPTRLDYIFTRKRMRPVAFERLTDFPSDHYGLLATLAI